MFAPNSKRVFMSRGDVHRVPHTMNINNAGVLSHRKNGAAQGGNHLPSLSGVNRVSLPDAPRHANAAEQE